MKIKRLPNDTTPPKSVLLPHLPNRLTCEEIVVRAAVKESEKFGKSGGGKMIRLHIMNRRKFLQLTNTIFLGATGAAFLPLPAVPSRKIEYLDEISQNYRAWREAQIEIVKQGYKFRSASLERPVGGFRRARVYATDETGNDLTLTWLQPWCGEDV